MDSSGAQDAGGLAGVDTAVFFFACLVIGFVRGTRDPNRFDEEPLQSKD